MRKLIILLFILFIFLTLIVLYSIILKNDESNETYTPAYLGCYKKNKFCCTKPRNYHCYGSNLCDPTQDKLPITMPNPYPDLEPVKYNSKQDEIICNLKYGIM